MKNEMRASITDYLSIATGNELSGNRVNLGNIIHPSHERAFDIISKYF
jgi:hypothetical protein